MSDVPSSSRSIPPSPDPEGPGRGDSSITREVSASGSQSEAPGPNNPPTVISSRPPLKPPSASEAVSAFQQWGLAPGDRLAHFELVDFVGGGGMGRVFRAFDRHLSRTVALKVLSPDQAADAPTLMRFRNEAQSAARLDHANIVRVYYLGEDRGIPFIVFEYIEGQNIRDLVAKRGPMSLPEAVSYTLQVAEALTHAARHEVVHRDIKPSNVLVTADGVAKLIDLGLARVQDPTANDLTASGVTLGTFDYISPEQARDPRTADVRSDIYSLGCTFFYMLAGRPPFPEGTVLQKLLQHQGDQPPEVRELRPDVPEEVSRLLRKMLAKDPRHRHQTPVELVEELVLLAEQVGLRPLRSAATVWGAKQLPAAPFWTRHLPWILPVAALVLIVVLLDWLSAPSDRTPRTASHSAPTAVETAENTTADKPGALSGSPSSDSSPPANASSSAATTQPSSTAETPPSVASVEKPVEKPPQPAPEKPAAASASEPASQDALAAKPTATAKVEPSGSTPTQRAPPVEPSLSAGLAGKQAGLLVVGDELAGARMFSSLSAACAAAASGDVIELRYNGRRAQRPTVVGNVKVTIRGGDGYRPVIVFRPDDPDPIRYPHSMLSVIGGQITLRNLAVELEVPRDLPAENWSLIEILGAESVRLRNCWLTIRNAGDQPGDYHQDVAFFRLRQAPGAELSVAGSTAAPAPAGIELDDCVARGEAVFLRTEGLQPVRLSWANGLLVTSQYLLWADGGPMPARSGELRQLDLQHVTAVVRRGLCRLTTSQSAPHQLLTQVRHISDSILIGAPGGALIEQSGAESVDQCRGWLEWNGDRVFYQGWEVFWTIGTLDASAAPESMSFDAWQLFWGRERESRPELNRVVWKKTPDFTRPAHVQTPADYALAGDPNTNPARGAASDGEDAGFEVADLPAPPSETESEPSRPDDAPHSARLAPAATDP
jgi:serine/threonine protein kinase